MGESVRGDDVAKPIFSDDAIIFLLGKKFLIYSCRPVVRSRVKLFGAKFFAHVTVGETRFYKNSPLSFLNRFLSGLCTLNNSKDIVPWCKNTFLDMQSATELCPDGCECRRFIAQFAKPVHFSKEFPKCKAQYVVKQNGGLGPLYWTQAQSPTVGEKRDEYRHRLVYDRNLRWGIKEATEIANDWCAYHNRKGAASGQDYVFMGWEE